MYASPNRTEADAVPAPEPLATKPGKQVKRAVKTLDYGGSKARGAEVASGRPHVHERGVPGVGRTGSRYSRSFKKAADYEIRLIKLRLKIQDTEDKLGNLLKHEQELAGAHQTWMQRATLHKASEGPGFRDNYWAARGYTMRTGSPATSTTSMQVSPCGPAPNNASAEVASTAVQAKTLPVTTVKPATIAPAAVAPTHSEPESEIIRGWEPADDWRNFIAKVFNKKKLSDALVTKLKNTIITDDINQPGKSYVDGGLEHWFHYHYTQLDEYKTDKKVCFIHKHTC